MPKNVSYTKADYRSIKSLNESEVVRKTRPDAQLPRCSNSNSRKETMYQCSFKGSNLYGFWLDNGYEYPGDSDDRYTVWSYGSHFPLYVYVKSTGQWFYNTDRYSSTTSKQMSQCRPRAHSEMTALDTESLIELALVGFTLFSLNRIGGLK